MFDELKKSISALLYERTTSPLFGTLIVSWSLWNWKVLYLTFFISENKLIGKNKIEYISENYNDSFNLLWFPLISTAILITLIPYLSNGAYWISIKFLKWKKDKKNEVEMNQLLTLEQSIELREQISNQELKLSKIVEDKNLEIKQLNLLVNNLKNQSEVTNPPNVKDYNSRNALLLLKNGHPGVWNELRIKDTSLNLVIENQQFENVNLDKVNLKGCTIINTDFINVSMVGAKFSGKLTNVRFMDNTILDEVSMQGNLSQIKFLNSSFNNSSITKSNLTDSNFSESSFNNSLIKGSNLKDVKFINTSTLELLIEGSTLSKTEGLENAVMKNSEII